MTADDPIPSARIRDLNDAFRRSFVRGTVVITAGVEAPAPLDPRQGARLRRLRRGQ